MDEGRSKFIAKAVLFISVIFMFVGLAVSIHILFDILFRTGGSLAGLAIWVAIFFLACYLKVVSEKKLEKNNGAE